VVGEAGHRALEVLVFLLAFVAGANTLPLMLAAPLMDPISVATEGLLGFPPTEGGLRRIVRESCARGPTPSCGC